MEGERILIIGDIHGCLDMLNRLMDRIQWRPDRDRLIFVGDYVDRGTDSKGVVDYVLALRKCSSRVDCLIGNHEAMLLDYLDGKNQASFLLNGGWPTLVSYGVDKKNADPSPMIPPDHLAFYRSLKLYVELEDFYVVHAGFRPKVPVREQNMKDMLWIRYPFIYSDYDFGKKVIFGHTVFREPLVLENKIGLDTGAVFGNKLTCLELPGMIFHFEGP